jgi:hypothetical protein
MYPSDGAQVWARFGGLPIMVLENLDAPARDTGCLQQASVLLLCRPTEPCYHSKATSHPGDHPGAGVRFAI